MLRGNWLHGVVYVKLPFVDAVRESVHQNARGATLIYSFSARSWSALFGQVAVRADRDRAAFSGQAAREGAFPFIEIDASVSLNLAIFQPAADPILDGGMILLLLIRDPIRRDLSLQRSRRGVQSWALSSW